MKDIFHTLESLGSARIEGNRTTLAEFIETKLENNPNPDEKIIEILNVEKAINFIDQNAAEHPLNRAFIGEIHKIIVKDLNPRNEGDETPGIYRTKHVIIKNANHTPPDASAVAEYMDELLQCLLSLVLMLKKDVL